MRAKSGEIDDGRVENGDVEIVKEENLSVHSERNGIVSGQGIRGDCMKRDIKCVGKRTLEGKFTSSRWFC